MNELLQTKLMIPSASQNQVLRPRLTEQLNAGANCALTLVSALAGSGKTTLLGEWSRQTGCPVAWISLDQRDNDPVRFENYLAEALRSQGLVLSKRGALTPDSLEGILESTLVGLINRLVEGQFELALVLDDYHLIDNPAIHAALIFFVENLPAGFRLMLSTRVDPPFPLARLRGRGQLAEVRFDSLRFTAEEAVAFLSPRVGGQLGTQEVEGLNVRTEGWVTGLQLAALSLGGSQDPRALIESFNGSQRHVLDYLVDEVIGEQTQEVQGFLLKSSILELLSGPLCSAVTLQSDGEAMLEALERANLFVIPLDQNRRWYRYHHLFAEVLRERLARDFPRVLSELHLRASTWYAQNGLPAEAIDHALAAGDPPRAVGLIERFAEDFWMSSQVVSLLRWIQAIPLSERRSRPRLSLWEAWMLLLTGGWQQVDPILETVDGKLEAYEGEVDERRDFDSGELKGMLAAARAFRANTLGNTETAIHHANQVKEFLSENNLNWRGAVAQILGDAYRLQGDLPSASQAYTQADAASRRAHNVFSVLVSLRYQAEMQVQTGNLRQAEITFQKALRYTRQHEAENLSAAGTVHISLGTLYYQKGLHDRARRHLEEGLTICEATRHGIGLVLANGALARLCHALGEKGKAHLHLDRAEQHAESHELKQLHWYPKSLRVRFHLAQALNGGLDRTKLKLAESWAAHSGLKIDEDPSPLGLRHLVYARLLVLQGMVRGDYADALNYLDAVVEAARLEEKIEHWIAALNLRARALHRHGDADGAVRELIRALEVGKEHGFVQVFLDEGDELSELLHQLLVLMPHHAVTGFAARVLARFGQRDSEAGNLLDKLFSPREIEVIHLMAEGCTNRQIAEELVVAESTVKTHLHHIYQKLKVSSRTQAVHRLRSMNLLKTS